MMWCVCLCLICTALCKWRHNVKSLLVLFIWGKKKNKNKDVGKFVRRFYEELPATDSQGYWPEQQGLCGKSETCSGLCVQVHLRAAQKGEVNTKCHRDCFCNGQRLFLIWRSFLPIEKCGSLAVSRSGVAVLALFLSHLSNVSWTGLWDTKFICRL